jgi:hypothetical protein
MIYLLNILKMVIFHRFSYVFPDLAQGDVQTARKALVLGGAQVLQRSKRTWPRLIESAPLGFGWVRQKIGSRDVGSPETHGFLPSGKLTVCY